MDQHFKDLRKEFSAESKKLHDKIESLQKTENRAVGGWMAFRILGGSALVSAGVAIVVKKLGG